MLQFFFELGMSRDLSLARTKINISGLVKRAESFELSRLHGQAFAVARKEQLRLQQQHLIFRPCCEHSSSVVLVWGSDPVCLLRWGTVAQVVTTQLSASLKLRWSGSAAQLISRILQHRSYKRL